MNNAQCRFGYPRCHPKTIIARVQEGEDSKQLIEQVPKLHIMIEKCLASCSGENIILKHVFQTVNITKELYISALKISRRHTSA